MKTLMMKTLIKSVITRSPCSAATAMLLACGLAMGACDAGDTQDDDSASDADADADGDTDTDTDTDTDDAGPDGSLDTDDSLVCEVNNGVAKDLELAGASGTFVEYRSYIGSEMPYEVLRVQIFEDNVPNVKPGMTYDLAGTTYDDCEICVTILTGCYTGPCERVFYPVEGSIEILDIGGEGERFAAKLEDIRMAEFDIVEGGITTEPLEGGDDWCIPEHGFDMIASGHYEARCGRPTVPCFGDEIPDFELEHCASGEMVSWRDLAGGGKAMVFTMVAGWCPACKNWVPELYGHYEERKDRGMAIAFVYGEDDLQQSPDAQECLDYADLYGVDRTLLYMDHDGEFGFVTTMWNMWPFSEDSDQFGIPWTTILDAETYEYVFTTLPQPTGDFLTVLDDLLAD